VPRTTLPKKYISIADGAALYGISERTIRRRIADGSLRSWRVGPKLIRIDLADLERITRRVPAASDGA
jgi:excisionase family DNA binding protein